MSVSSDSTFTAGTNAQRRSVLEGAATRSKPPTCEKCSRKFSTDQHLRRHRSSCETQGRRSFVCQTCEKAFTRKDVLKRHAQTMHKMRNTETKRGTKGCLQCANLKIKFPGGSNICEACRHLNTNNDIEEASSTPSTVPFMAVPSRSESTGADGRYQPSDIHRDFDAGLAFFDEDFCNNRQLHDADSNVAAIRLYNEHHDTGGSTPISYYNETLPDALFQDYGAVNGGTMNLDWLHSALFETTPTAPKNLNSMPVLPPGVPLPIAEPLQNKSSWSRFWQPEEESATIPQLTLNVQFPATEVPLSEQTRTNLIKILGASMSTRSHREIDLETLPSKEVLGHCLSLYFKHFDPIQPIFHVPTFNPDKTTEVLLAVMIGIGSAYSTAEGAQNFANCLVELAIRTLTWMGDIDPRYRKTMFYVVALVLVSYYTVGAGNKKLLEESESLRSHLIVNARYMGVFDPQTWDDDNELQTCWLKWRDEELRKRLAWTIFALDSSVMIFTSVGPSMSLLDLNNNLPCDECLWTAPTAHSWRGTYPWLGRSPRGLPFLRTFRDLVSGKPILSCLSPYSRRLCAQVLQRLFRDMKELESSSMSRILALPLEKQFSSGGAIMKALTRLLESVTDTQDFAEYISYATVFVITHYICLCAPPGALDQMVSLLRTERNDRRPILDSLERVFAKNPADARRLAWHAAQILALFRHRPMDSPLNPIRVFMAGYYLYMFTSHFSDYDSSSKCTVMLENLWPDKTVPNEWIFYGGTASFGNISLCKQNCKSVLKMVLESLRKLRVWGVSQQLYHILVQVAEDDDRGFK